MGSPTSLRPSIAPLHYGSGMSTGLPSPTTFGLGLGPDSPGTRIDRRRKPQAYGVSGSHGLDATHSGILTSVRSTRSHGRASLRTERSPTDLTPSAIP